MNVQRTSQNSQAQAGQATKKAPRELIVTRPPVEVLPDSALVNQRPAAKMDAVEQKKPRMKGTEQTGQVGTVKPPVKEAPSPANAIEKEVLIALHGGHDNVSARAAELKELMTTSRMTQEGLDRINVQVTVLETVAAGGKPGLEKKSKDLQHMLMVAMMDERGYKNVTLQIEVLDKVAKDMAPIEKRMGAIDSLMMRALLTPDASMSLAAERRALKAFLHGGPQVASEIATTEKQLSDGVATPQMKDTLTLELSALIGVKGGLTGVRARIQEVKNIMMVSRFTADGLSSITRELNTLEALEKTLSTLERRSNQIGE